MGLLDDIASTSNGSVVFGHASPLSIVPTGGTGMVVGCVEGGGTSFGGAPCSVTPAGSWTKMPDDAECSGFYFGFAAYQHRPASSPTDVALAWSGPVQDIAWRFVTIPESAFGSSAPLQSQGRIDPTGGAPLVLDSTPTPGNLGILIFTAHVNTLQGGVPSGWQLLTDANGGLEIYGRIHQAGDTNSVPSANAGIANTVQTFYSEWGIAALPVGPVGLDIHEIAPPGDTINFVGTLDDAFNKSIRPVRNEPGSGQFTINRNSANATADILKPGNLVKVCYPEIDPDYIFAWFMEPETSTLISLNEEGGEDITIGGRGALSYWDRVIWQATKYTIPWWPATMATPPGGTRGAVIVKAGTYRHYTIAGDVITGYANFTTAGFSAYFDSRQTYQWPSAGSKRFLVHLTTTEDPSSPDYTGYYFHPHQDGVTEYLPSYATGTTSTVLLSDISADKPGAILYRMYQEGTDASRPDQPIPLMTIDFTATNDSNGDPWATTDALAGVTAELGETFLDTIVKLLATGVIDVEMGPDLDMHAYNAQGRDLTGAFGAGVVRFEKGVNIADELKRERSNVPVATHIEVIGTDGAVGTAVLPDAASRVTREVATTGDSNDPTVLAAIGLANLNARLIASDAIGFRIASGDDDGLGRYLPGPDGSANGDFWLGDVVTLHTGSGDQDFDEADERVYAITIAEDDAGNLEITPEVGSVLGAAERALYGGGTTVVQTSFQSRSEFTDTSVAESAAAEFATPAIVLGTAAAAGSAPTVIRSDATIVAFDATAPSTQAIGDAAAAGSAAVAAKRDHKHAITNPLTTQDDLWIGGASGAPARLAKGSDSQVLTVDPSTHHLVWATPSGGSGSVATDVIWDAKGDLAAGTGADTASKLTVGANDTILMADSAQSTGLKWVASQTPTTQAFSDAAAQGTADTYARGDHKHGMPTGAGGVAPPASVDGLWTWLKADAITGLSDGDPVVSWPNSVGQFAFDAQQGTTAPIYKTGILNSLPIVRFGGAAYMLLFSEAFTAPAYCYFVVFKASSIANAYSGIIGFSVNGDSGGFFIKSNGKSAVYPGGATSYDGTGAITYGTTNWNYIVDNHGPVTFDTRRNGVADKTGVAGYAPGLVIPYHAFLGNQFVGGRIFSGDIAEVLIYARKLSSTEVTAVEGYISAKYAI